jgi:UDP-4-amino-4,6-dideoxy-N-acetyl-beta-L-altrosamine N-acetyltransferase
MREPSFEPGTVRRMTERDLELVLGWRNHPQVRAHMFTHHEISIDEHFRWFAAASKDDRQHVLIFETGGEPQGYAHLSLLAASAVANWGFYLSPAAPRGSGKRLGSATLDHAFRTLTLHKVCGQALAQNDRSINMHIALGFKPEGVLREQHFDGEAFHDVHCFGLLDHEWLGVDQPNLPNTD